MSTNNTHHFYTFFFVGFIDRLKLLLKAKKLLISKKQETMVLCVATKGAPECSLREKKQNGVDALVQNQINTFFGVTTFPV